MIRWALATSMLGASAWLTVGERAQAGRPYIVSEQVGGNLWRMDDLNGDGDALDVGERVLWGTGFTSARGMEFDGTAVYVVEQGLAAGTNQIVRLSDSNRDGDALDIGERTVWLDGLNNPRDIAHDGTGHWYLSEFGDNRVWRLVDTNHDGDVLDLGEKTLFADAVSGPSAILPQNGAVFVGAETGNQVHRLIDLNGDGDVLDIGENLPVTPNYSSIRGLLGDGQGGFFFSSYSTDIIYHAADRNGDGDMLDVAEVLSYADNVSLSIDGPWGMAAYDGGAFLLADSINGQIKLVRDITGDDDAFDRGEVVLFADGLTPVDIVALNIGLAGDYNRNGVVDSADYVIWRKTLGQTGSLLAADGNANNRIDAGDYDVWRANFGQTASTGLNLMAFASAVPEQTTLSMLIFGLLAMTLRASYRRRNIARRAM
jgi:hypothetical protein